MLELTTFGGLELRTEAGDPVEGLAGHTKHLALLAYLAVEARGFRRWADRKRGHLRQRAYEAALSAGGAARHGRIHGRVRPKRGETRRNRTKYGSRWKPCPGRGKGVRRSQPQTPGAIVEFYAR